MWIIAMCRHAPQMARNAKRRNTARRKPPLLLWLTRIFGRHRPARLPRDATRQVRRAFVRRNYPLDEENH
jgi:hypothetical protein